MYLCVVLCATLLFGSAYAKVETSCRKSGNQWHCQKPIKKKAQVKKNSTKPKPASHRRSPSATPDAEPSTNTAHLTSKQEAMREAYTECISWATPENPTQEVVQFVFAEQLRREQSLLGSLWKRFRGSVEHHGHEVCLTRAYGLRVFRSKSDIVSAQDKQLTWLDVPHVEVPDDDIPIDRRGVHRFVRPWVRVYIESLALDFHVSNNHGGDNGAEEVKLRVTSMTRSAELQNQLVRQRLSPADCRYEFLCSSHTSGSSFDIGLKGVSRTARAWLQDRLVEDQKARKIFFIIENSHYHVFVLPPKYIGEE